MKNQYVGDIGDYGKYGLLRFLAGNGIKIGVNWYLTENDGTNDGEINKYLGIYKKNRYPENIIEQYKRYDSELFEKLQPIVAKGKNKKRVQDIKNNDIILNAVFFDDKLEKNEGQSVARRKELRDTWHENALKKLSDESIELIFADPDNGTLNPKMKPSIKNGEKYATLDELSKYYNKGKNVVYYCHKARRSKDKWKEKKNEFKAFCPDAKIIVLTFRYGTQRSFIFAVHLENYDKYNKLINDFLKTDWGTFTVNGKKNPPFNPEEDL